MRQGEDHGRHDRQKDAVGPDHARALHDVSAKEKLLRGRLDRSEDQCQWHEERERRQVEVEGKGVGVEEVLSQRAYQTRWNGPRHKPLTDATPIDPLPRRHQRPGVAAVDTGNGDENPREEERETHHNKQELPERTKHGVIRLAAERERDEYAGTSPDHQPRKEDDHQSQQVPPPPMLTSPGGLYVSRFFNRFSRRSFGALHLHLRFLH